MPGPDAPRVVRPMLAVAGVLPPVDQQDRYAFEMKWDGVRAVVHLAGAAVRVLTRNDREVASTYPELAGLAGALAGRQAVLDGEVVALDAAGRPSFGQLQARMHVQSPGASLLARVPVVLLVFDVLHLDGHSLLTTPYDQRRMVLGELALAGESWAVPPAFEGAGLEAIEGSRVQGLEGVVAKRRDSTYQPGRRSPHWIKVKHLRMQEVVVGGWSRGSGRREGSLGSLLLGVPDGDGRLTYAGQVGTGFTDAALSGLVARLRPLASAASPFADEVPRMHARDAQWVRPELVGEVVFAQWTREGRLRHPSWRGLRPDKEPQDVRRED